MDRIRVLAAAVAATTLLGVTAAVVPARAATASGFGGLSAKTVAQIDALAAAKAARTPSERKVDSALLTEMKQRAGLRAAAGVNHIATGVQTDKGGRTRVDVRGDAKTVAAAVRTAGGQVLGVYPKQGVVHADVPLAAVTKLATSASVTHIGVADRPLLADSTDPATTPSHRSLPAAPSVVQPAIGSIDSQGDVTHAADKARARYKVTGTGVTVGVLSDGVDSLAQSIASGDLPPDVEVLPDQAGDGDEGTAMLEIVHDLAPHAKLMFATAFTSAESFADNIRALRAAGADIIVDDVLYYAESPFQDGPIAQAVIDVTNDGALYFSSAGNENNVDDHTAGNWEGDYVSSGKAIGKFAGIAHDFDPGPGVQVLDPVSDDSAFDATILQWNDPLGASGNDYDLYAVDASGNVIGFSNDVQDGDDDPFEAFGLPPGSVGLAVVKFSGADRYFQLTPFRGYFESRDGLTAYSTPGVTRGHSAVPAAFSVAAVPAADPFGREIVPGVANPSGPYPGVFTRRQLSEVFTSDGPRRVFYQPDGTPITPGNLTSTGGEVRAKPDVSAADGVDTSVAGFAPFFGTSASAPHAAAIAALVLSGNPGMSPADVRAALTGTAIDIEAPGYDRDTGYGIVMANRVLQRTGATPQPLVVAGQPQVHPVTGDGDAYLEPGESADVTIPVINRGDATATQVSVQLSTTSPGVTITPTNRRYGNVAVGATKTGTPFRLTLPASWETGEPVALDIRVSFVGALSPQTSHTAIPTGQPSPVVDVPYTGPPVAIPDADPTGVSFPLQVSGVGRLSSVTFSIDGTSCTTDEGATTVGIDHTYTGDLSGELVAPDGTTVSLFSEIDGSGNNVCQAVFDDT
ncbi:MAG TPA: S8 family serine peptidase, partial [Jatrophihabitantaceae bacterium]